MARPGEAPAPVFTGMPYGANQLVNQMSEAIPEDDPFDDGFDELAGFEPGDDKTAFLFSETDRPDEPLTAGMAFGAGPDFSRHSIETDTQFRSRVSSTLADNPDKDVQAFRIALERGF